jgi:hypothetical protein
VRDRSRALALVPGSLAVCRLDPRDAVPAWATSGALSCVTRTASELSIVCAAEAVPAEAVADRGWRALRILGPLDLDLDLVGVLAGVLEPLADAAVSVFVISTHDSDFVLVRERYLERAIAALTAAGHPVEREGAPQSP